ncbi:hypothetical protein [Saccharothrix syringae]|uniref:Uncharacterized protein n=1 Tax=Saccharothrix syringae TaxID=103733 RepID=A0A5Q0GQG9_SACSY|nr:hypothetical protein [Saccharothrix syringae]QFZ16198.1 hypothetical protein EKG83_00830 [Saccharothrix syringae]
MSDGYTVPLAMGAPAVQVPPGFTPSAAVPPAVVPPVAAQPTVVQPTVVQPAVVPPPAVAQPAVAPPTAAVPDPGGTTVTLPAPVTTGGSAPVPAESFAEAAQTDLDKANVALDAVDKQAVQLDLDRQGVEDLVKLIAKARGLVDSVYAKAVSNLDVELKFGNNWVSEAISRRLREVAVGDEASAVNVIGDFMQVLFEVEETVRKAARNLEEADDDAADAFGSAGEVQG